MTARWYTRRDHTAEPKGPFDAKAIADAVVDGHLSRRTEVREDGETEWRRLDACPALWAEPQVAPTPSRLRYAGFWRRTAANLVDVLIFVPPSLLLLLTKSPATSAWAQAALGLVMLAYHVVMHARWGQTLGKMAVRIRVVTVSGNRISWKEALLRSSVDCVLFLVIALSTLVFTTRLGTTSLEHPDRELIARVMKLEPVWGKWAKGARDVWFWGELFVLLFNDKKRALHDFLAGTVVLELD